MKQLTKLRINKFVEMSDSEMKRIFGGSGSSGGSGNSLFNCSCSSEGANEGYESSWSGYYENGLDMAIALDNACKKSGTCTAA